MIIDVLRASTTIVHALAAGAAAVIPCREVEEARKLAASLPSSQGQVLLGGERQGKRIEGFDLDNSPLSYTPDVLSERTVVFTTTNGTRAMQAASRADRILVGAFVNLHAVLECLLQDPRPVHLVCAGTDGEITAEDVLFAGALSRGLKRALGVRRWTDDGALLAEALYETRDDSRAEFLEVLYTSRGGRNLVELGYEADIERAAVWDLFDLVPELTHDLWQIRPAVPCESEGRRWLTPPL